MSTTTTTDPTTNGHDAALAPPVLPRVGRVGVGSAMRRYWPLVALPVILLAALALAAGYVRSPTYTAESRLAVGRIDASTPGALAGFTSATQALAETYSRSVRGDAVLSPVAGRLRTTEEALKGRVNAAPIPQSPVFRVRATGASAAGSVRLANAVSGSLVSHSERQSRETPNSAELLRAYREATLLLDRRRATADAARRAFEDERTATNRQRLSLARAEKSAVELRVDSLGAAYAKSRQSTGSVALVEILERATGARSDRFRVMQLLLFVAVLAGLAVGVALALVRANRAARSAMTLP
jgi:capsular polysaccharide biosynthesis protein